MKRVRINVGNDSHDYLIDPEHLFNVAMARNSCCAHARAMLGVLMFDKTYPLEQPGNRPSVNR